MWISREGISIPSNEYVIEINSIVLVLRGGATQNDSAEPWWYLRATSSLHAVCRNNSAPINGFWMEYCQNGSFVRHSIHAQPTTIKLGHVIQLMGDYMAFPAEEFDGSIQNIRGLEIVQSATVVEHRRYNNVVIDNGHASDATDGDNDIDEEKGSEMINRRVVPYDPMDSDSRNHNVNNNAFAEMSESVPPTFQMDLDELIDDST
eukprot:563658_1